jgi:hypothetical protein
MTSVAKVVEDELIWPAWVAPDAIANAVATAKATLLSFIENLLIKVGTSSAFGSLPRHSPS